MVLSLQRTVSLNVDWPAKFLALRPVSFRYKKEGDPNSMSQFGLVAEDVEKVIPF